MPAAEGRPRDHADSLLAVSPCYVEDGKAMEEADPSAFDVVKCGEKSITEFLRELKRCEREAAKFHVPCMVGDLLSTTFQVIFTDPPGPYSYTCEPVRDSTIE